MDKQYHILINKDKKKNIYLSVENIKEHMKYEIHINEISPFWLKNMKYFQHDFDNFYHILDLAFVDNSNEIKWSIKNETEKSLILNIIYNPGLEIFGFNITMEIPREEDKTEQLIKKVKKLENEITYILSRLDKKDIQ